MSIMFVFTHLTLSNQGWQLQTSRGHNLLINKRNGDAKLSIYSDIFTRNNRGIRKERCFASSWEIHVFTETDMTGELISFRRISGREAKFCQSPLFCSPVSWPCLARHHQKVGESQKLHHAVLGPVAILCMVTSPSTSCKTLFTYRWRHMIVVYHFEGL